MMIRSRTDYDYFLRADLHAYGESGWRFSFRFTRRQAYWHMTLRRAEYHANLPRTPSNRLRAAWSLWRYLRMSEKMGYTIPLNTFGPGLSIAHKGTVVVNDAVKAGRDCRLHPDCTIGETDTGNPTLGDEVWVAAGARILGGISIGDRVAVGANAVVLHDVLDGVTVAGIPARVVSHNGSTGYIRLGSGLPSRQTEPNK
jgi:serine O-acetyltransferase